MNISMIQQSSRQLVNLVEELEAMEKLIDELNTGEISEVSIHFNEYNPHEVFSCPELNDVSKRVAMVVLSAYDQRAQVLEAEIRKVSKQISAEIERATSPKATQK